MSTDPRRAGNSKSGKPYFDIEAESIVCVSSDTMVQKLVIFKPAIQTLEHLRKLSAGELMGPIRLIDSWDDGSDDVHVNEREYSFVSFTGSGYGNKTSAYTLTMYNAG